jgi:hypothetical protein
MVVHQGLAYIPTATGGGGGAGSPWVGAVITVGLLISPVALPHLSRRLKTLMVRMYASSSLLKKKNTLPSLCSWICEISSCGLQKRNSFFHQSMSLLEFRTFFQQSFSLLWDSEILFNNLSVTSGIRKFLLKISHFFFFFYFFFSGFFCLQASGFK